MQPSFLRSAATGILIAAVLVTVVWSVGRITGDEFRVQSPGSDTSEKLPIFFPPLVTVVLGVVGTGVALIFRRRRWGSLVFYGVAVVCPLLYGFAAFGGADTTGTAIWLNVMHVVAAAAIVPALGRMLNRSV